MIVTIRKPTICDIGKRFLMHCVQKRLRLTNSRLLSR